MLLLVVAFLGTFGLVISVGLLLFYRDAALTRLSSIVEPRASSRVSRLGRMLRPDRQTVERALTPFQTVLPRTAQETSITQTRLIRAGYRKDAHVNVFYGAKVVIPIALTLIATGTQIYTVGPFFIYGLCVGLGFLLPDFWLSNRMSNRQTRIRLGLPEALDLMVICTEAGLSLDQTLLQASKELRISQPEISDELSLMLLEQRAGRPRMEALKSFAERVGIDSVRALVNTLVQATTFGTSVAKTLRVYSDTMRTQRRQHAEEQAAKTTVKLVFPLVLFIFPALFIVALGPAMILMFDGFNAYLR